MAPGQGACDDCGAVILVLFTTSGHLAELDPEPVDDGTRLIVDLGGWIRARTLTGTELPHLDGPAYRLHRCEVPREVGAKCAGLACPGLVDPLVDAYHAVCHPEVTDQQLAEHRATVRRQFRQGRRKRK